MFPAREQLDKEQFENLYKAVGQCKESGCETKAVARGLCSEHGERKFGADEFKKVRKTIGQCKEQGCEKRGVVQGYCHAHGRIKLGDAPFDSLPRSSKQCRMVVGEESCQKKAVHHGYCHEHAREQGESRLKLGARQLSSVRSMRAPRRS